MPVQQAVDIGVPLQTVYNQFTQFEEWPKFMHRVQQVSQEDESHVAFKAKIWGKSKEFKAEIDEQRPDERIKWRVVEGMTHTGVVTFHELGPRLTRVEVSMDVEPGSLIEKAARGMRHVKRAVRADLARFKAYVMMEEDESGSWRGEIDDGEVKKRRSGGSRRSSGSRGGGSSSSRRSGSQSGSGSSGGQGKSSSGRSGGASRSRASSSGAGGRSASARGGSTSRSRSRSSSNGSGSRSSNGAGSRSKSRKTSGSKS
jgi:carbon monoxide dehydrogenase subunit G